MVRLNGKKGHEPHEGNKAPALCLDAGDQAIEPPARLSSDPIRCEVARNEECSRGTQCRADEIKHRPPKRSKERAACAAEDRARNEEDGSQGKQHDVAERRPQAETVDRALHQRRIETIAIECEPDRDGDEESEHEAGKCGAQRCHSTGSRRPSG